MTSPPCSKHEAVRDKMKCDGRGVPGSPVFLYGEPFVPRLRRLREPRAQASGDGKGKVAAPIPTEVHQQRTQSMDNFDGGQNGGCGLHAMCGKIEVAPLDPQPGNSYGRFSR